MLQGKPPEEYETEIQMLTEENLRLKQTEGEKRKRLKKKIDKEREKKKILEEKMVAMTLQIHKKATVGVCQNF